MPVYLSKVVYRTTPVPKVFFPSIIIVCYPRSTEYVWLEIFCLCSGHLLIFRAYLCSSNRQKESRCIEMEDVTSSYSRLHLAKPYVLHGFLWNGFLNSRRVSPANKIFMPFSRNNLFRVIYYLKVVPHILVLLEQCTSSTWIPWDDVMRFQNNERKMVAFKMKL